MLDHPVVDAALGLIFFYVIMSLFVSAIQEWIATLFSLRSKSLKSGIARLIGNRYAEKVYGHPLIGNMAKQGKLPSCISPETLRRRGSRGFLDGAGRNILRGTNGRRPPRSDRQDS